MKIHCFLMGEIISLQRFALREQPQGEEGDKVKTNRYGEIGKDADLIEGSSKKAPKARPRE